jgi:hypothetical protein
LNEPGHLLDLIRAATPKVALFTTYTFSVSHFDSVFLPVLRSVGCQDIAVLVDAGHAGASAAESQSRAAGRIYQVAKVVAPGGGVFHPKLAYLASESGDVLAVGSGNLTASGQSLQLECFDSVTAAFAPFVFGQLADWMEQLGAMVKQTSPQAARVLEQTALRSRQAERANSASGGQGASQGAVLVQTLSVSAREMLEEVFKAAGEIARSVTILSPYHSPDGGPAVRLAQALGAASLSIGIDGRRMLAPFSAGKFKPAIPGRFVVAETKANNKKLHAKVFEIQAETKALVLTGSVNATAQSFESTQNVEVSLARWLPSTPFSWREVQVQGYEVTQQPSDFEPRPALYIEAYLGVDRNVHGQVTARAAVPTTASADLHVGDDVLATAQVEVRECGAFQFGPLAALDTSRAIALTVSTGEAGKLLAQHPRRVGGRRRGTRASLGHRTRSRGRVHRRRRSACHRALVDGSSWLGKRWSESWGSDR